MTFGCDILFFRRRPDPAKKGVHGAFAEVSGRTILPIPGLKYNIKPPFNKNGFTRECLIKPLTFFFSFYCRRQPPRSMLVFGDDVLELFDTDLLFINGDAVLDVLHDLFRAQLIEQAHEVLTILIREIIFRDAIQFVF